jgi:hypothetical protein
MHKRTIQLIFAVLCLVVVLVGFLVLYNPTRTVTPKEFLEAAKPNLGNTIITVSYYCGSKEGFDYFVVIPPMGREQKYRLPAPNSIVHQRFAFSNERSQWHSFHSLLGVVRTNQVLAP